MAGAFLSGLLGNLGLGSILAPAVTDVATSAIAPTLATTAVDAVAPTLASTAVDTLAPAITNTAANSVIPELTQANVAQLTPEMFSQMSPTQLAQAGTLDYTGMNGLGVAPNLMQSLTHGLGNMNILGGKSLLDSGLKLGQMGMQYNQFNKQNDLANKTLAQNQRAIDSNQAQIDRSNRLDDERKAGLANAAKAYANA